MYKLFEKYKKVMLAVFGVALMIVFILPSSVKNRARHMETAFHVGKDEITAGEARLAAQDWETLRRDVGRELFYLFPSAPEVPMEIEKHHELFLLLQKEAERANLTVPEERVTQIVRALASARRVSDPVALQHALRGAMLVSALVDHVGDSIKISKPLVLREMADDGQRIKLDLVHYSVNDFKQEFLTPSADEIQKQFDTLKAVAPGNPTDTNPFGFGYLIPSQVRLLYLTIPHDEVVRAVRKSLSDFDWEVKAVGYYKKHLSDYPATSQPASKPTSGPSQAASKPAPTTKPFAEVKEQIISELMKPEVDQKTDAIANALTARMTADFEAKQKKSAAAAGDFGTRQYLDRIAADIEKQHGVKLGVSEINEPKDEKGLRDLKGIGSSFVGEMSFPQYVLRWAEPLIAPVPAGKDAEVLSLDEPSRHLRDLAGNVYVFQLRDATPAHPPAKLDAVKDKVINDLRARAAYEAAFAAAKKFHAGIDGKRLEQAAKTAGKDVFSTPFFDRRGTASPGMMPVTIIPKVDLPEDARQKLIGEAFALLSQASIEKPHPTTLTELPIAGRVVVSELADVERPWKDDQQELVEQQVAQRMAAQRAQRILGDYFKFDTVKRRLDYRTPNEKS